jgi:lysophospholipase L1-like esterase
MILILFIRFLIFGDSLSCNPSGWQSTLEPKVVNLSSVGKTTSYMLKMLKKNQNKITPETKVIIFGGVNDVYSGLREKTSLNNIQEMVDITIKHNGTPIVILGFTPTRDKSKVVQYIKLQKNIATTIKNAQIIPVCQDIKPAHLADGIHLNSTGNKIFKSYLKNKFAH